MRSRKKELEEFVTAFEGTLKSLLTELRHLEDEAAKLHKQRVCNKTTVL